MQPDLNINWAAIPVAGVAAFFLSFLWWGPLFGKTWAKGMGMNTDEQPEFSKMIKPMLINLFGVMLMAYVLTHSTNVWRGSVWGASLPDMASWQYGMYGAIFTWLGFYVPVLLNGVAWEQKPWSVFFINAGGHLVALAAAAQILANWYP